MNNNMGDYSQAIRDPIHGFIGLTKVELAAIDCKALQRLRLISQLGLTDRIYPGARHSRFEHALGTLQVATRVLQDIRGRVGISSLLSKLGLKQSDRASEEFQFEKILRLARWVAMLHDVGHAPFSHVTENLLPDFKSHEQISYELIQHGDLGELLKSQAADIYPDLLAVMGAFAGIQSDQSNHPMNQFVRSLIAGPIGADRMDYLLRDSAATGVSYGLFDLGRVSHTLVPVEVSGNVLMGIEAGGMQAVEGLLISRLQMFQQVYSHRTRRILDIHLREFLIENLPNSSYPADLGEYLDWNDARIWEMLRLAAQEEDSNPELSESEKYSLASASAILKRKHFRALDEQLESEKPDLLDKWMADWKQRIQKQFPNSKPVMDFVPSPWNSASFEKLWVQLSDGRLEPIMEQSNLLCGLGAQGGRSVGRLYVSYGERALQYPSAVCNPTKE